MEEVIDSDGEDGEGDGACVHGGVAAVEEVEGCEEVDEC